MQKKNKSMSYCKIGMYSVNIELTPRMMQKKCEFRILSDFKLC